MYTITRTSTAPKTPLRIQISQPDGDTAGLAAAGTFYFAPAGSDGDTVVNMTEHQARAIMGDVTLAEHFHCDPPLPAAAVATPDPVAEPEPDAAADDLASPEVVPDGAPDASKKKTKKRAAAH
jgi:hypothetical protein